MVSKASELLPLPESPVTTTMTSRGSETVMFFRLCSRAPWTAIWLSAIFALPFGSSFWASIRPPIGRPRVYPGCADILSSQGRRFPSEPRLRYIFSARAMILKELSRILAEELSASPLVPGDATRPVRGLAVEEPAKGWLEKDEVAITIRERLDDGFLRVVVEAGSPAVVWRREGEPPSEVTEKAAALGLGLILISPEVP